MYDDPAGDLAPHGNRGPSMGLAVVDSMATPHFKAFLAVLTGFSAMAAIPFQGSGTGTVAVTAS
jgi:hypothetical protein